MTVLSDFYSEILGKKPFEDTVYANSAVELFTGTSLEMQNTGIFGNTGIPIGFPVASANRGIDHGANGIRIDFIRINTSLFVT